MRITQDQKISDDLRTSGLLNVSGTAMAHDYMKKMHDLRTS